MEKERRGFASLTPARRREIATLGGKAAHAKGTAHRFTPAEASAAGRKGGQASQRKLAERRKAEADATMAAPPVFELPNPSAPEPELGEG
jgi:general stress protein YciG